MIYHLLNALTDSVGIFRVVQYPSFRVPAAMLTALVLMLWLFPGFIRRLREWQHGVSNVREDTPERHQVKKGTPTMGGLFVVGTVLLTTLLWADLSNLYVWSVLIALTGFGAIGFVDDTRKIKHRNSKGLPGRSKLLIQVVILCFIGVLLWAGAGPDWPGPQVLIDTHITVPFVPTQWFHPDLGWAYPLFAMFIIVGTSNAVNLTDGLDGLAIGPTIVSSATFLVLAYAAGLVLHFSTGGEWAAFNVADYLHIPHVPRVSELSVVCAAMVGAGVGFLWFNAYPASVFMGDVGSLALGGALGTIAILTKNELLSAVIHGVFLMEAVSVIFQVASFKLRGKRIFRMAPIHHHFELKGWAEPKIIVRFWIISIILALIALTSLKLR